jgi:hypothetical protein
VLLTAGRNGGVKKNSAVCFYRQDQTPLGCHKAYKVLSKKAWVSVPRSVASQLNPGLPAIIGARGSADGVESKSTTSFFHMGYVFSATTPYSYNATRHNQDSVDDNTASPWTNEGVVKSNPAAIFLGSQASFTDNFGLYTGVIARIYAPETTFSATYPTDDVSFTEHKTVVNAFSVPISSRFTFGKKKALFVVGGGLQVDYSQVKFKAWQVNDDAGSRDEIASYLSTVTTLGLRLDLGGAFKLNKHQLSFILGLVSPMSELNRSSSVSAAPPGTPLIDGTPGDDLETAINHNKSSLGIDIGVIVSIGS